MIKELIIVILSVSLSIIYKYRLKKEEINEKIVYISIFFILVFLSIKNYIYITVLLLQLIMFKYKKIYFALLELIILNFLGVYLENPISILLTSILNPLIIWEYL